MPGHRWQLTQERLAEQEAALQSERGMYAESRGFFFSKRICGMYVYPKIMTSRNAVSSLFTL